MHAGSRFAGYYHEQDVFCGHTLQTTHLQPGQKPCWLYLCKQSCALIKAKKGTGYSVFQEVSQSLLNKTCQGTAAEQEFSAQAQARLPVLCSHLAKFLSEAWTEAG
jgi:hypothetical protein